MNIAVVGLGLIGGSLAMTFRQHGHRVVGVDPDETTRNAAIAMHVADLCTEDLAAIGECEFVVLAAPLGVIVQVGRDAMKHLAKGAILVDAASVKSEIVAALDEAIPETAYFVGGHPMFGVERRGISAARRDLVVGAPFVITPTKKTASHALDRVEGLFSSIGMRTMQMAPDEHDAKLATLSHLPQLLAIALSLNAEDTRAAGPSFRGATRTAMSPPHMLSNIVDKNRVALVNAVAQLHETLVGLLAAPPETLEARLVQARERRLELEAVVPHGSPSTVRLDQK